MKTQRGTLPKKFITTLKKAEPKEILNKLIPFMVRQAHHERNQLHAVRPELVEGLNQKFPYVIQNFAELGKTPAPQSDRQEAHPYRLATCNSQPV